jgi:protein-tyrosine-phosphatase
LCTDTLPTGSIIVAAARYNASMATVKHTVLFVCVGNACRSPMAEAIARQIASEIIEASSAGLYPLGHLPDATEKTLIANGYSIEGLASKPLLRADMENADLIINMSGQPLRELLDNGDTTGDQTLAKKIENWHVEDPYGADPVIYQRILEELESRVLLLASRLRSVERAASS